MNNAEFENKMFHHVNENCRMKELDRQEARQAADKARLEAYYAAEEERKAMRICMKRNASARIVICIELFVYALAVMFFLNWKGIVPPGVHEVICGAVGLVTGLRVNALFNRIKK